MLSSNYDAFLQTDSFYLLAFKTNKEQALVINSWKVDHQVPNECWYNWYFSTAPSKHILYHWPFRSLTGLLVGGLLP